jgi:predicted acetyltransferase
MQIRTIDKEDRHKRELWIDDETKVAHLWVIDYTIRIGTARVSMAGIGGVYTEREHRMKGYMRHLFEDTVHYMIDQGYDVTMLFGIPDFYTKFGYAVCLAGHQARVKTRDAEDAGARAQILASRPIEAGDMPAVVALYNDHSATRTGSVVRDPDAFTEFALGSNWGTPTEAQLWEDDAGALLGYVVWDKNATAVKVTEAVARDDALFPTLLHALAQQAIEKRCEEVQLYAPPDDPFAEYIRRFGARWEIAYPRHGDGMMRVLNQQPLFEKLLPELALRTGGADLDNGVTLALRTDLGTTTLIVNEDGVTMGEDEVPDVTLALTQDKLMQLIVGYRSLRDVLNSAGVTLNGEEMDMLNALFPKDVPYIWHADHF